MEERYLIRLNGLFVKDYKHRLRAENYFSRMVNSTEYRNASLDVIGVPSGHIYCTTED